MVRLKYLKRAFKCQGKQFSLLELCLRVMRLKRINNSIEVRFRQRLITRRPNYVRLDLNFLHLKRLRCFKVSTHSIICGTHRVQPTKLDLIALTVTCCYLYRTHRIRVLPLIRIMDFSCKVNLIENLLLQMYFRINWPNKFVLSKVLTNRWGFKRSRTKAIIINNRLNLVVSLIKDMR